MDDKPHRRLSRRHFIGAAVAGGALAAFSLDRSSVRRLSDDDLIAHSHGPETPQSQAYRAAYAQFLGSLDNVFAEFESWRQERGLAAGAADLAAMFKNGVDIALRPDGPHGGASCRIMPKDAPGRAIELPSVAIACKAYVEMKHCHEAMPEGEMPHGLPLFPDAGLFTSVIDSRLRHTYGTRMNEDAARVLDALAPRLIQALCNFDRQENRRGLRGVVSRATRPDAHFCEYISVGAFGFGMDIPIDVTVENPYRHAPVKASISRR